MLESNAFDAEASFNDAAAVEPLDVGRVENPTFDLGQNDPGQTDSAFFQYFEDGMDGSVMKGPQGAWMLVLAARTNQFGCCLERVDVRVSVDGIDGTQYANLRYKRRPLYPGADGQLYLMNVFVVVGDPEVWDGQFAEITFSITPDVGGQTLTDTRLLKMVRLDAT